MANKVIHVAPLRTSLLRAITLIQQDDSDPRPNTLRPYTTRRGGHVCIGVLSSIYHVIYHVVVVRSDDTPANTANKHHTILNSSTTKTLLVKSDGTAAARNKHTVQVYKKRFALTVRSSDRVRSSGRGPLSRSTVRRRWPPATCLNEKSQHRRSFLKKSHEDVSAALTEKDAPATSCQFSLVFLLTARCRVPTARRILSLS